MAILSLGEIDFEVDSQDHTGGCRIKQRHRDREGDEDQYFERDRERDREEEEDDEFSPVHHAASLLGLSPTALSDLLTIRSLSAPNGEKIQKRLSVSQAVAGRNALAKTLYRLLFDDTVSSINTALQRALGQETERDREKEKERMGQNILLVDIFGKKPMQ